MAHAGNGAALVKTESTAGRQEPCSFQRDVARAHPVPWWGPRRDTSLPPPQPVTLSPLLCCDRQTSPSSQDHQLFTCTIFLNIDVKSKFPARPSPAFQMRFSRHKDPSSHRATASEGKRDLAVTAPGWAIGVRRRSHLGWGHLVPVPRRRSGHPAAGTRRRWEERSGNESTCLTATNGACSPPRSLTRKYW